MSFPVTAGGDFQLNGGSYTLDVVQPTTPGVPENTEKIKTSIRY